MDNMLNGRMGRNVYVSLIAFECTVVVHKRVFTCGSKLILKSLQNDVINNKFEDFMFFFPGD